MLNFTEFTHTIIAMLEKRLETDSIETSAQLKNNGVEYLGLTLDKNSKCSPIIYLEDFFKEYEKGATLEAIVDKIIEVNDTHQVKPDEFSLPDFFDWDSVKDKVCLKIVNTERNAEFLQRVPHKEILNLSAIFFVEVHDDERGVGRVTLLNPMFDAYGITLDDLFETAKRNTKALCGTYIQNMGQVLAEMVGAPDIAEELNLDEEQNMYVVSTEKKINGACCLLDEDALNAFIDKRGSAVYILPSSIHELILVPEDTGMEAPVLLNMVKEVNETQVSSEDFLADAVYRYSKEEGLQLLVA